MRWNFAYISIFFYFCDISYDFCWLSEKYYLNYGFQINCEKSFSMLLGCKATVEAQNYTKHMVEMNTKGMQIFVYKKFIILYNLNIRMIFLVRLLLMWSSITIFGISSRWITILFILSAFSCYFKALKKQLLI